MARLKPMTPLRPLMQTNVKPPSPLRAPEQQALKPMTPLRPKTRQNPHFSPAKAMVVSVGAEPARAKATPVSGPRAHERAKATAVSRERFVMPAGYGGAWPVFDPTRRTTHQRPGTAGMEGAGGHKRAWLRRPWAAAGPGRASSRRAEPLGSQRGRRAGGPPPTGTQSSPAQQAVGPDSAWNTSGLRCNGVSTAALPGPF